jgi:tetratricopeptide (TPR) repeat protein
MAHWGVALAVGPNINDEAKDAEREKQAFEASRKALAMKSDASEVERALIDAMTVRFPSSDGKDRPARMVAYAAAMEKVYDKYPADPDVATLYAGAVMETMPWNYYMSDGKPKPDMVKAIAALEKTIAAYPEHPGANHYYIHAVEASPTPDRAIPSAERLLTLVPGAGHLVHMPSHVFIRVGRYDDGVRANNLAVKADEDYVTACRAQGIYPAAYYPHNVHFLTALLAFEGRSKEMMQAAEKVSHHHGQADMADPKFAFPHLLHSIPDLARVRFGMWEEILKSGKPEGSDFHLAMWRYARGMAYAATKRPADAGQELSELRRLGALPALAEMKIFDVNALADLAAIATDVLAGEISAKQGKFDAAIRLLRRAAAREDALHYSEPPDWPNPVRHNLGAVLLEAGKASEAEKVFRQDLDRHRENGWALIGLARALEKQGRTKEAEEIRARFNKAWERADLKIESSRI